MTAVEGADWKWLLVGFSLMVSVPMAHLRQQQPSLHVLGQGSRPWVAGPSPVVCTTPTRVSAQPHTRAEVW